MAGVDMEEELAGKDDLILALNSGSSSLKFGIYYRGATDEEPLLTGSAEGIGHSNGSLHIRSSDGRPLILREGILESQSDALRSRGCCPRAYSHRPRGCRPSHRARRPVARMNIAFHLTLHDYSASIGVGFNAPVRSDG